MKVEKILYQKIFPTGMAYLNHKIGVEVEVEEGDDYDECFRGAKALVEQWNIESNPSYAMTMEYMKPMSAEDIASATALRPIQTTSVDPKESAIESHIKTINECQTLNNLNMFKRLVENTNDTKLLKAFNDQYEKLLRKSKS